MSVPYGSDPWLEARLRNVPLPPGMIARLNEIASEPSVDEATSPNAVASELPKLCHPNRPVPVGPGLSDGEMDRILGDVSVPAGLRQRLERIALEPQRSAYGRRLALAASVLIAVGAAYWAGSGNLLSPQIAATDGSLEANQSLAKEQPLTDASPRSPMPDTASANLTDSLAGSSSSEKPDLAIEELRWQLMQEADVPERPLDSQKIAESSAVEPDLLQRPNKSQVFASSGISSKLPGLELVRSVDAPRGIAAPTAPGYDLRFRAKYGENPYVVPRANKSLQSLRIPLVNSSASYDHAWRQVANQKLPLRESVVVEQFLAAVDYAFPAAPANSLRLHVAAGPAPFASGHHLLQLGVQAGDIARPPGAGTRLTVIVQLSEESDLNSNLGAVRRVLAELAGKLGPADRISLVSAGKEPRMLLESAGRNQAKQILSAIQKVDGSIESNLSLAIEIAYAALAKATGPADESKRVVLLTDSFALNADTAKGLEDRIKNAASQGIKLNIVHLDLAPAKKDVQQLKRLATLGGGARVSADNPSTIRYALLESLTGVKQTVARRASLQIRFNPQLVDAYRLLGHETATLTGSATAPLVVDLQAEETATALLELRLNPRGGEDLAIVELTWLHPATNQPTIETQIIQRSQFAKDYASSALSLQSAALVAHTAEILRGSQFALGNRSLEPVLQLASQASTRMFERPSMRAFQSFVQQAEKVRLRGTKR
jgi:Ca-activated chloride channel family protein